MTKQAKRFYVGPLRPGKVVVLKSGGPDMTVKIVGTESAICQWFGDDATIGEASFPIDGLVLKPDQVDGDDENEVKEAAE